MRLPFPKPEDSANCKLATKARDGLIAAIDEHSQQSSAMLNAPDAEEQLLRRIDTLTYQYFGLTQEEIDIIEDGVNLIIPASQPSAGTYPEIWKSSNQSDRKAYSQVLRRCISEWFGNDIQVSTRLIARNLDFAILCITLDDSSHESYTEEDSQSFTSALKRLSNVIGQPVNENFVVLPDIRLFSGANLYLIKPLQKRFWLKSTALADADSLAHDLESMQRRQSKRGAVS
jgi:hypothetical protein